MRTSVKKRAWVLLLLAGGCSGVGWNPIVKETVSVSPQPPMVVRQDAADLQNRFADNPAEKRDAVQDAVMWSEKYRQLSETTESLWEKNAFLAESNTHLKQQVDTLQAQLDQARKELDEANSFLQKMHLELNQWKTDVLGFREEMRRSQTAQMTALAKILRILGAEPVEPSAAQPAK